MFTGSQEKKNPARPNMRGADVLKHQAALDKPTESKADTNPQTHMPSSYINLKLIKHTVVSTVFNHNSLSYFETIKDQESIRKNSSFCLGTAHACLQGTVCVRANYSTRVCVEVEKHTSLITT